MGLPAPIGRELTGQRNCGRHDGAEADAGKNTAHAEDGEIRRERADQAQQREPGDACQHDDAPANTVGEGASDDEADHQAAESHAVHVCQGGFLQPPLMHERGKGRAVDDQVVSVGENGGEA